GQPARPPPAIALLPNQNPARTSSRRAFPSAASLVHNTTRPQTPLCAVCLAIASPTLVEARPGHACTLVEIAAGLDPDLARAAQARVLARLPHQSVAATRKALGRSARSRPARSRSGRTRPGDAC